MVDRPRILNVPAAVQGPRPIVHRFASPTKQPQRVNAGALIRGPSPTVLRAPGMPEPLTSRKSWAKPCCDDCGKAEALGKPKPCGRGAGIAPQDLRTRLPANYSGSVHAPLLDRLGRADLRFQTGLQPSAAGPLVPFGLPPVPARSCLTLFTQEQRDCFSMAREQALAAAVFTPGPDGRSAWDDVIRANGTNAVSGVWNHYAMKWQDVWIPEATACLELFPPDVRVGPWSVAVQVDEAMRVSPDLQFENMAFPGGYFFGYWGVPDGWYDPLCREHPLVPIILRTPRCRPRRISPHEADVALAAFNYATGITDLVWIVDFDHPTARELRDVATHNLHFSGDFVQYMSDHCGDCVSDGFPLGIQDITCLLASTSVSGLQLGENPPLGFSNCTRQICRDLV